MLRPILLAAAAIFWALVYGTDLFHKYVTSRKMLSPARKSVLITGCDSGFGNMCAKKMNELGMQVFAGCLTQAAADQLASEAKNVVAFKMDVTKKEDIQKAFEIVSSKIDDKEGLWALINNAGIGHSAPFDWQEASDTEKVMQVNFLGGVYVTKTFLPLIKKAKGRIIAIASVLGFLGVYGGVAYSASKHAVEGFYSSLRMEMRLFGVGVSIVEPGMFKTQILQHARAEGQKFWDSTPASIQQQYGLEMANKYIETIDELYKMGDDPVKVRDTLIEATLSVSPRAHYPVGNDMQFVWLFLRYWPARTFDWVYIYLLRRVPPIKAGK